MSSTTTGSAMRSPRRSEREAFRAPCFGAQSQRRDGLPALVRGDRERKSSSRDFFWRFTQLGGSSVDRAHMVVPFSRLANLAARSTDAYRDRRSSHRRLVLNPPVHRRDRPMAKQASLLEASRRARFAMRILGIVAAVHLVMAISEQMHLKVLEDALGSAQTQAAAISSCESREALFQIANVFMVVIAAIAYCSWLRLAYENAAKLGQARYLRGTPQDAVVSFFIPFLNIIRPYQHIQSLWKASDPRGLSEVSPERQENPAAAYRDPPIREVPSPGWKPLVPPIGAWWTVWMIAGVLGGAGSRSLPGNEPENVPAAISRMHMLQAGEVFTILAAVLAILVIRAIDASQIERQRRRRAARAERA
jgi:hypothetical protein